MRHCKFFNVKCLGFSAVVLFLGKTFQKQILNNQLNASLMLKEEVRKIMTKNPVVAHPEDLIEDVASMMVEKQVQQIPVVKNGKLVGLITSFDLWKNSHKPAGEESTQIKDVMSTTVSKIAPKDKVGTAAELFIDNRFKTVPVVNLDNELKGVITAFDVIKHVMRKEYPVPILYKDILEAE